MDAPLGRSQTGTVLGAYGHRPAFAASRQTGAQGRCGLCQRPILMPPATGLLQPSPDRIDSNNPSYRADNVHITHLGCNYAKNKYTTDQFEEWLEIITSSILQTPEDETST